MFFRYSNIFVTSPSPENLKTLFEFIFKGFDALDYQVGNILLSLPTFQFTIAQQPRYMTIDQNNYQ